MEQGLSHSERTVEELVKLLGDPEPETRAEARKKLQARGKQAIPKLLIAVEVGSGDVRFEISKALTEMGQPAIEPMLKAILHPNVHVRETAARVLSLIGGPEACQRLDEAARAEKRRTVSKELREASAKIRRRLETQKTRAHADASRAGSGFGKEEDLSQPGREERQLYLSIVRNLIVSNWAKPPSSPEEPGQQEVLVTLKVEPDGTVSRVLIENKWQNTPLGNSLKDAIRRSSPLPPVPDVLAGGRDEIDLTFVLEVTR